MNSKSISLAAIVLLFCLGLHAQVDFPDHTQNQKWEVVTWDLFGNRCFTNIFKNGDVAEICGNEFIEVFRCDENEENCRLNGYYRIQGDSILTRINMSGSGQSSVDCSKPAGMIYDFGALRGENLECAINYFYNSSHTPVTVEESSQVEYEGHLRTTWLVSLGDFFPGMDHFFWIDGVGSNVHPFYSFTCMGDGCEIYQQVTKVWRNGERIYTDTVLSFSCPNITSDGTIEKETNNVRLHPNPTTSSFVLSFGERTRRAVNEMKIYNQLGELVMTRSHVRSKDKIDVTNLIPGIYYVYLYDAERPKMIQLVIQ